jgi:hypothetical protein
MDGFNSHNIKRIVVGPVKKLDGHGLYADSWTRVVTIEQERENYRDPENPIENDFRVTFHAKSKGNLDIRFE